MPHPFSRTELLFGRAAVERLSRCSVLLFGVGGVGSYTAEALARGGVGGLCLVDNDTVALTNLNRQLVALHSTLGMPKALVMANRCRDINPDIHAEAKQVFFTAETAGDFDFSAYDYIVDAIDTVSSKLLLAELAQQAGVPLISCMGAGNKLDPSQLEVTDIYKTSVCPLARVMRAELRKRGINALKVVYSREPALVPMGSVDEPCAKRQTPGSVSFVPSAAGLLIASEVLKDLTQRERKEAREIFDQHK